MQYKIPLQTNVNGETRQALTHQFLLMLQPLHRLSGATSHVQKDPVSPAMLYVLERAKVEGFSTCPFKRVPATWSSHLRLLNVTGCRRPLSSLELRKPVIKMYVETG